MILLREKCTSSRSRDHHGLFFMNKQRMCVWAPDDAKDKRLPICHLNSLYRHELFASRRCLILPITPEISVRLPSGGIGEMPSLLIFLKCCNTDLQKLRTYRTKLNYIKMTRLGLSLCTKNNVSLVIIDMRKQDNHPARICINSICEIKQYDISFVPHKMSLIHCCA